MFKKMSVLKFYVQCLLISESFRLCMCHVRTIQWLIPFVLIIHIAFACSILTPLRKQFKYLNWKTSILQHLIFNTSVYYCITSWGTYTSEALFHSLWSSSRSLCNDVFDFSAWVFSTEQRQKPFATSTSSKWLTSVFLQCCFNSYLLLPSSC